jgi:hypothetical protein
MEVEQEEEDDHNESRKTDMDRLKDDLDQTEAALRSLKSGIDFSSRLPTEKLRREYLSNFLRAFEKEQNQPMLDNDRVRM